VMLRAAQKTLSTNWTWMIVGDGARQEALEKEANRMGLTNLVFTGRLPKEEMPLVWSSLDICFIHLKKSDLFSTVIPSKMFEAMAMEKPILMGVLGEAGDILERSGAGFVVEPENEDALIDKVNFLFSSPESMLEMGKKGRSFVRQEFNRDNLAEEYLKRIQEI